MARGPWYISASAVRDYLQITRQPVVDHGPEFASAEKELIAICEKASEKRPRRLFNGQLQYRGGRPLRLRLIVSEQSEGPLPALVQVLPWSEAAVDRSRGPRRWRG